MAVLNAAGGTHRIVCDTVRCPDAFTATTVRGVMELARDEGWRCDESGDWCPYHKFDPPFPDEPRYGGDAA